MYFGSTGRSILRESSLASFFIGIGAITASSPVFAQEEVWPSNAEAHPGEIVYSRDVPYGAATRRFAQGEARTVAPDQSELIIDSLLIGLDPISDAEQASVSAPLGNALTNTQGALDVGLSPLADVGLNSDFTRSESGASGVGSIVSRSLSVLPSALGVIGETTGSGQ